MKVFFKNIGVLIFFLGLTPFILMFGEGFDTESFVIGVFCLVLGGTLFKMNA